MNSFLKWLAGIAGTVIASLIVMYIVQNGNNGPPADCDALAGELEERQMRMKGIEEQKQQIRLEIERLTRAGGDGQRLQQELEQLHQDMDHLDRENREIVNQIQHLESQFRECRG